MYVRGMGRYRRGLGEFSGQDLAAEVMIFGMGRHRGMGQTETICPGDPSCPGMMTQTPLTPSQIAAMSAGNAAYFGGAATGCDPGINPNCGAGQTITQWLNTNSKAVLIGAGLLVALAVLK